MENNYYGNRAPLPNATVVLVLGIVSIVVCCCYGIIGLICGIIALILANQAVKLYEAEPEIYTESSYKNAKAGKICAIIGISLSALSLVYFVVVILTVGLDALSDPELLQERIQELLQQ